MKYVKVLNSIQLFGLNGEQVVDQEKNRVFLSFKDFVIQRLRDPKFGKNFETTQSLFQIKEAASRMTDYLELETKDWELLKDVVKEPTPQVQYNPELSHNLLPFMNAIIEASDTRPEEK